MSALRGVPEEMDIVTDRLRRVAVMTHTVGLARRLDIEARRVGRRRHAARPSQSSLHTLSHLIYTDDKDHLLRSPGDGSHPVSVAINVHNDAILRDSIGAGQIDV